MLFHTRIFGDNFSLRYLIKQNLYDIIVKRYEIDKKGGYGMPRVCSVSGKKTLSGNKRSHSLRATRRKWNVNLQNATIMVDGKPTRVRISARALKSLKAQQAK